MAADRSPWVDQGMSFNWNYSVKKCVNNKEKDRGYVEEMKTLDMKRLVFCWMMGLKTGKYYNRIMTEGDGFSPTTFLATSNASLNSSTKNIEEDRIQDNSESMVCNMSEGCAMCHG